LTRSRQRNAPSRASPQASEVSDKEDHSDTEPVPSKKLSGFNRFVRPTSSDEEGEHSDSNEVTCSECSTSTDDEAEDSDTEDSHGLLKDANFVDPGKGDSRKIHRAIKTSREKQGWNLNSKKNVLVVRFVSDALDRRYNLVLRSAGMGGKHPRGKCGRTASHTEPQLAALLDNPQMQKRLTKKVGAKWHIASIYSSNLPCSSAGGGTASGCGGMARSDLGSPARLYTNATSPYRGGKGPNLRQVEKMLRPDIDTKKSDKALIDPGSSDTELDEANVRAKNLTRDQVKPEWSDSD
jgi:hypothetical protein